MDAIDAADAVLVISPLYFAGVPSQFKAMLDRFQPRFWKRQRLLAAGGTLPPKKPLYVALVGEGGDPYGSEHALAQIASPFALADHSVVEHRTFIRSNVNAIAAELRELIDRADQELAS